MKNEQYLLGNLRNFYRISSAATRMEYSNDFQQNLIRCADLETEKNSIHQFLTENGLGFPIHLNALLQLKQYFYYIVSHTMKIQLYETDKYFTLEEGTFFQIATSENYSPDTGMVLIDVGSEKFVASIPEVEHFSIPCIKVEKEVAIPFVLFRFKSGLFTDKLDIVFDIMNLDYKYHLAFLPFIATLKEFIELQDDYVYPYFLANILSLLEEAKKMLNSDLSENDKKELLADTIEVLNKLKSSINDVSSFRYYSVTPLEHYIFEYYKQEKKKEDEEANIRKAKEAEAQRRKKEYMETIKAKSELLDHFNTQFRGTITIQEYKEA